MAKGLGLIGNFRGKFGNAVGYNLKDSNNKQTQGIRIYQPIVKNPKTAAQAEQRAKLAPINATYRVLKPLIDRGQEGVAYGNKSRRAWLSTALKADTGAWVEKGEPIKCPWLAPLSKGSLTALAIDEDTLDSKIHLPVTGLTEQDNSVKRLSGRIIDAYPTLQDGDQLTFVVVTAKNNAMQVVIKSILLDRNDEADVDSAFTIAAGKLSFGQGAFGCVIVSRESTAGGHLRSTASLIPLNGNFERYFLPEAKEAAIRSYMLGGKSSDWAEDPNGDTELS